MFVPDMVSVLPDKVHVISAWIVAKEKRPRRMSNKDFFINFENKKIRAQTFR